MARPDKLLVEKGGWKEGSLLSYGDAVEKAAAIIKKKTDDAAKKAAGGGRFSIEAEDPAEQADQNEGVIVGPRSRRHAAGGIFAASLVVAPAKRGKGGNKGVGKGKPKSSPQADLFGRRKTSGEMAEASPASSKPGRRRPPNSEDEDDDGDDLSEAGSADEDGGSDSDISVSTKLSGAGSSISRASTKTGGNGGDGKRPTPKFGGLMTGKGTKQAQMLAKWMEKIEPAKGMECGKLGRTTNQAIPESNIHKTDQNKFNSF